MPQRTRLALTAGLVCGLCLDGAVRAADPAEPAATLVGTFTWQIDDPRFGGFSGLDLGQDGRSFVVVSDRGHIVTGVLERDEAGAVERVQAGPLIPLRDTRGAPLGRKMSDAEGVAVGTDGEIHISFEGEHRVWSYRRPDGPARPLPLAREFRTLQHNASLEALAIDDDGRLHTLPERSGAFGRPFPVWQYDGAGWREAFTLPRDGDFLPVGADFGPDGQLYLLERDFRGFLGFRTRVSRFETGPDGPGPRVVLIETTGPLHGNLEGIAVWKDSGGATRLTMVEDDNFSTFQSTRFVDYRIAD